MWSEAIVSLIIERNFCATLENDVGGAYLEIALAPVTARSPLGASDVKRSLLAACIFGADSTRFTVGRCKNTSKSGR